MKLSRLPVLLVLLMVTCLSACQDDKDDRNDNNGGRRAALPLTQTFTFGAPNYGYSFKYPENWITDNTIAFPIVASSQAALDKSWADIPNLLPGEVFFFWEPLRRDTFDNFWDEFTPAGVADFMRQPQTELSTSIPESVVNFGTDQAVRIGGKEGVKAAMTSSNTQMEGTLYAIQYSENIILMLIGAAHPGEWENYAATAEAVIASFEIQLGTANQTTTPPP